MSFAVRILRGVFERALDDVRRPHAFALERVGFFFGRVAPSKSNTLVLLNDYTPVQDAEYIPDDRVGARINSTAIRTALQRALTTSEAVFHFHVHSGHGLPGLSRTDASELGRLMPSFGNVAPAAVHGAIIANVDCAGAWLWPERGLQPERATSVSVVGFPTSVWRAA
jgi:hypothetical protein